MSTDPLNSLADCILFECLYQEKLDNQRAYNHASISRREYARWVEKVIDARAVQGENYREPR
jgi:hypothetical protein